MPYKIRKLPNRDMYRVHRIDPVSGRAVDIKAKETTLVKARAMVRLLRGIDHGWKPSRSAP